MLKEEISMNQPFGLPWEIFILIMAGAPGAVLASVLLVNSNFWKRYVEKYYNIDDSDGDK